MRYITSLQLAKDDPDDKQYWPIYLSVDNGLVFRGNALWYAVIQALRLYAL